MMNPARMMKSAVVVFFLTQLLSGLPVMAAGPYRTPAEVDAWTRTLALKHSQKVKLHDIATSPGGSTLRVIEIGNGEPAGPAIFVAANFDGITPLATAGAIALAESILDGDTETSKARWYILPLGNPDAAQNFHASVKRLSSANGLPINNDMDEQSDEDGNEDLNNDGFITQMRVKAPDGEWRVSDEDPRLLVKADASKGEKGIYKLYTEGTDNDGDGQYNEDGPGGVNPGINFPHEFSMRDKESGLWPGSTPETFGVMKFIYDHPEIVMTVTLGESNLLADLPQEGKTDFDPSRIRIPERLARSTGLSPTETYTMEALVSALSARYPDMMVDENMIISQLGLGPEKSFKKGDITLYTEWSKSYKKALETAGISSLMAPEKPRNGSFELWSYFHLGVPSVALSLWEPEAAKDTTAKAPGNGARGADAEKKPSADKQLLDYLDAQQVKGFADWKAFRHPQLGDVEIGGFIPYAANTPSAEKAESILKSQIPWIASLASMVPDITPGELKVTSLGAGVYRIEWFVTNQSRTPWPTEMGLRNQQPAPVMAVLKGSDMTILEGLARTPVSPIGGNQSKKLTWLVKNDRNSPVTIELESPVVRKQSVTIPLSGN